MNTPCLRWFNASVTDGAAISPKDSTSQSLLNTITQPSRLSYFILLYQEISAVLMADMLIKKSLSVCEALWFVPCSKVAFNMLKMKRTSDEVQRPVFWSHAVLLFGFDLKDFSPRKKHLWVFFFVCLFFILLTWIWFIPMLMGGCYELKYNQTFETWGLQRFINSLSPEKTVRSALYPLRRFLCLIVCASFSSEACVQSSPGGFLWQQKLIETSVFVCFPVFC